MCQISVIFGTKNNHVILTYKHFLFVRFVKNRKAAEIFLWQLEQKLNERPLCSVRSSHSLGTFFQMFYRCYVTILCSTLMKKNLELGML